MDDDIEAALTEAGQLEKFQKLSLSHVREYLKWINEAKKPETRAKRIQKMCEMLGT